MLFIKHEFIQIRIGEPVLAMNYFKIVAFLRSGALHHKASRSVIHTVLQVFEIFLLFNSNRGRSLRNLANHLRITVNSLANRVFILFDRLGLYNRRDLEIFHSRFAARRSAHRMRFALNLKTPKKVDEDRVAIFFSPRAVAKFYSSVRWNIICAPCFISIARLLWSRLKNRAEMRPGVYTWAHARTHTRPRAKKHMGTRARTRAPGPRKNSLSFIKLSGRHLIH